MTIYEKAKSLVTAREAAEHYGLTVNRYGLALCPFHDDHNPSMKLDDRFHCFGCGEDGDVIVSNAATPSGAAVFSYTAPRIVREGLLLSPAGERISAVGKRGKTWYTELF